MFHSLRFNRRSAVLSAPLFLTLALAFSGCVTRKEVAAIVTQSNAAILAGQFGGLPQTTGTGTAQPWQESSDRLEAFIAAHPDQKATIAPLRVRQAMLLLAYRQFNLAQAAFNALEISDLHTDRDLALKRNQETLIWWFSASTNDSWTTVDETRAQIALKNLKEEQARVQDSPEIRDYLAEMRAWIGLSAARQNTDPNRKRLLIEETLDVYAGVFTPDDLAILAAGTEQLPDPKALGPDVRRRVRAKAVIAEARKTNLNLGVRPGQTPEPLGAHPKNATFDTLINK